MEILEQSDKLCHQAASGCLVHKERALEKAIQGELHLNEALDTESKNSMLQQCQQLSVSLRNLSEQAKTMLKNGKTCNEIYSKWQEVAYERVWKYYHFIAPAEVPPWFGVAPNPCNMPARGFQFQFAPVVPLAQGFAFRPLPAPEKTQEDVAMMEKKQEKEESLQMLGTKQILEDMNQINQLSGWKINGDRLDHGGGNFQTLPELLKGVQTFFESRNYQQASPTDITQDQAFRMQIHTGQRKNFHRKVAEMLASLSKPALDRLCGRDAKTFSEIVDEWDSELERRNMSCCF